MSQKLNLNSNNTKHYSSNKSQNLQTTIIIAMQFTADFGRIAFLG